jgi:hypothetical protein
VKGLEQRAEDHAAAWYYSRIEWTIRLCERKASPAAFAVLNGVCSYANKLGQAWPSVETLIALLGLPARSVKRGLREVTDAGIWTVTRRNRRNREANFYQLIFQVPNLTPSQPDQVPDLAPNQADQVPNLVIIKNAIEHKNVQERTIEHKRTYVKRKDEDEAIELGEQLTKALSDIGWSTRKISLEAKSVRKQIPPEDEAAFVEILREARARDGVENPYAFSLKQLRSGYRAKPDTRPNTYLWRDADGNEHWKRPDGYRYFEKPGDPTRHPFQA